MSCSCGHNDLGLEELGVGQRAAVAAGHMTADQAEKVTAAVKAAREVAQDAITRLEPRHISGFPMLLEILEKIQMTARAQHWIAEIHSKQRESRTEGT